MALGGAHTSANAAETAKLLKAVCSYQCILSSIWLSGIDVSTVTQLLDVKHNYACLPLFSSDEIDFVIEYVCTN